MVLMSAKTGAPWKLQAECASLLQASEVIQQQDSESSDGEGGVESAFDELQHAQENALEESMRGAKTMEEMIRMAKQSEQSTTTQNTASGDEG